MSTPSYKMGFRDGRRDGKFHDTAKVVRAPDGGVRILEREDFSKLQGPPHHIFENLTPKQREDVKEWALGYLDGYEKGIEEFGEDVDIMTMFDEVKGYHPEGLPVPTDAQIRAYQEYLGKSSLTKRDMISLRESLAAKEIRARRGSARAVFMVVDTRSDSRARPQGPYTEDEAERLANDLNEYVRRNAGITNRPFVVRRK